LPRLADRPSVPGESAARHPSHAYSPAATRLAPYRGERNEWAGACDEKRKVHGWEGREAVARHGSVGDRVGGGGSGIVRPSTRRAADSGKSTGLRCRPYFRFGYRTRTLRSMSRPKTKMLPVTSRAARFQGGGCAGSSIGRRRECQKRPRGWPPTAPERCRERPGSTKRARRDRSYRVTAAPAGPAGFFLRNYEGRLGDDLPWRSRALVGRRLQWLLARSSQGPAGPGQPSAR